MGDRGNVLFKQSGGDIYFYSHWAGSDLRNLVAQALSECRDRWNDERYATRYIVTSIVDKFGDSKSTTGWGLGTRIGDGSVEVTVDFVNETVTGRGQGGEGRSGSFSNFVDAYLAAMELIK